MDVYYYRCVTAPDQFSRHHAPLKPLSILALGGTGFIGPHQLRYAALRRHRVTLFNRGSRSNDLPDGVEMLIGDRDMGDDSALLGQSFDVCIDNA